LWPFVLKSDDKLLPDAITLRDTNMRALLNEKQPKLSVGQASKKMNRIPIARGAVVAVVALALVSGCSSTGPSNGGSAYAPPGQKPDNGNAPLFRGETRDQVLAQYDQPDQVFQSSETVETWVYFLGKAKQFIPFYGP
jgi:hypothetical protein